MKVKLIVILFCLFIAAILLRLWGLNSDGVLWFDEYIGYQSVYIDSIFDVQKSSLLNSKNPPLYYSILWIWMKIFGNTDWVMKLLSLIFGSLTVIASYFCGRSFEILNKIEQTSISKTGIIFAVLSAISSIGIYYSQEVKGYSLIILLSTFLLWGIIRIIHKFNNKNLIFLTLIAFLLLYSHILAFAFYFFVFIILCVYFYQNNKTHIKKILISSIILAVACIPLILDIFNILVKNRNKAWSAVWGEFRIEAVISMFNNFISPIIINRNEYGLNFDNIFLNFPILLLLIIFSVPLIIIYLAGLTKTLFKSHISRYLLVICGLYLGLIVILHLNNQMMFLTRYGVEVLPFLLLLSSYGFTLFNGRFINTKSLVGIILCINFIFMFGFPSINAQYLNRKMFPTNFKDLSLTLNKHKFNQGDNFLIVYYGSTGRFVAAPKYYDFSPFTNYIFHHCAFNFNDRDKCLDENIIIFENALKLINEDYKLDKRIVICIPSNIYHIYAEIIENANLEMNYKNAKKLDQNNWITLIYSK